MKKLIKSIIDLFFKSKRPIMWVSEKKEHYGQYVDGGKGFIGIHN